MLQEYAALDSRPILKLGLSVYRYLEITKMHCSVTPLVAYSTS